MDLELLNNNFIPVGDKYQSRRCQGRNLSFEKMEFQKSLEICEILSIGIEKYDLLQEKPEGWSSEIIESISWIFPVKIVLEI